MAGSDDDRCAFLLKIIYKSVNFGSIGIVAEADHADLDTLAR